MYILRARMLQQIEESGSQINRYYTWLALGRPDREPTPKECLFHYIDNGGAKDFANREQAETQNRTN